MEKILTSLNLPHSFFPGKTGSGKSGKNPDLGYLVFLIRFWLLYIKMGKFLRNKDFS